MKAFGLSGDRALMAIDVASSLKEAKALDGSDIRAAQALGEAARRFAVMAGRRWPQFDMVAFYVAAGVLR